MRILAILSLVLVASPASSQVAGRVQDEAGAPIASALVAVWGRGELLDEVTSDAQGRFASAVPSVNVRRISVHYLGFATETVDARSGADSLIAVLRLLPVPLPEMVVAVTGDVCDDREDSAARTLWEAARAHYEKDTGTRAGLLFGAGIERNVQSDALGAFVMGDLVAWGRRWPARDSSTDFRIFGDVLENRAPDQRYAWKREGRSSTEARFLNWGYPQFDGIDAYHVVTDAFGASHRFHMLGSTNNGTRLAFCPRDRDAPFIRGELLIAHDSTFAAMRWAVTTDEPRENAGGEVVFTEIFDETRSTHLVAAQGVFWHHDGREPRFPTLPRSYFQSVRVWRHWVVSVDPNPPDCNGYGCAF